MALACTRHVTYGGGHNAVLGGRHPCRQQPGYQDTSDFCGGRKEIRAQAKSYQKNMGNNERPQGPAGAFTLRATKDSTKVHCSCSFRRTDPCASRGRSFRRYRRGCGDHQLTRTQQCSASKAKSGAQVEKSGYHSCGSEAPDAMAFMQCATATTLVAAATAEERGLPPAQSTGIPL